MVVGVKTRLDVCNAKYIKKIFWLVLYRVTILEDRPRFKSDDT